MMNSHIKLYVLLLLAVGVLCNLHAQSLTKFAFIGDFGWDGQNELAVANLVKSWNPEFIITVGDDNYDNGDA